jgi:hypothetical protein
VYIVRSKKKKNEKKEKSSQKRDDGKIPYLIYYHYLFTYKAYFSFAALSAHNTIMTEKRNECGSRLRFLRAPSFLSLVIFFGDGRYYNNKDAVMEKIDY